MKNTIALLALGVLMIGTVACSSTPKEQEVQQAAEPVVEQAAVEPTMPVDTQSNTTSKPDLSLGAGSSGRGH